MKKFLITLFFILSLTSLTTVSAYTDAGIKVYLGSQEIQLDAKPYILNGTIMVPLRETFENCGCKVDSNERTSMIKIISPYQETTLFSGGDSAEIGNWEVFLDEPMQASGDVEFVPLTLISEVMCKNIFYNEKTGIARLSNRVTGQWYNDTSKGIRFKTLNNMRFFGYDVIPDLDSKTAATIFTASGSEDALTGQMGVCVSSQDENSCEELFQRLYNDGIKEDDFLQIAKEDNSFLIASSGELADKSMKVFEYGKKVGNKLYLAIIFVASELTETRYSEIVECLKSVGPSSGNTVSKPSVTLTPAPTPEPAFDETKVIKSHLSISGGYSHSVGAKSDGSIWMWGQLGELYSGYILTPTKVANITDVLKASAGGHYTLFLKKDGTVWSGVYSQREDSGLIDLNLQKITGLTNIIDISAGYDGHSLALKQDGTVYEWNISIGSGVKKKMADAKRIAAGYGFSTVLKNDGTVWIWFASNYGLPDRPLSPTKIVKLTKIADVSAGQNLIAALKEDGTFVTMGGGYEESIFTLSSPLKTYKIKGIKEITSQIVSWAVLCDSGTVVTGGYRATKTEFVPGLKDATEISYGGGHLLILKKDGSLVAMGDNFGGKLGDGTTISRTKPVPIQFNLDPKVVVNIPYNDEENQPISKVDSKKAKELDALADQLIKTLDPKTIKEPTYKTVKVSTAEDFIKNIKSNTQIVLEHGKTYNITEALDKSVNGISTFSRDAYDGNELLIKNISNLKVTTDDGNIANLLINPRYAFVINFENCNNITIENVRAGHSPEKGECVGGVFSFNNCKNIRILGSTLYGCGTYGVCTTNVDKFLFKNSIIEECTYGLMVVSDCKNMLFVGSKFRNTEGFDQIDICDSQNIVFSGCEITDNRAYDYTNSLWAIKNVSPMLVVRDSTISGNKTDYFKTSKNGIYFKNVTIKDNVFTKGIYMLDQ